MPHITPYEQLRYALNELMEYVGSDEFLRLPAKKRSVYLKRLRNTLKNMELRAKFVATVKQCK